MTPAQFTHTLEQEGFEPAVTITREADGMLDDHSHPFEAKALILSGQIRIVAQGSDITYAAGDVFHLHANVVHQEFYGPQGVAYQVGRKTKAA